MKQILKLAFLFIAGFALFTSCENDDEYNAGMGTKMEFISAPVAVENNIDFLWYKVNDAVSYTVQISPEETFETLAVDETLEKTSYTAKGLLFNVPYYSRIRANFANSSSDWLVAKGSIICANYKEGILKPVVINEMNGVDLSYEWFESDYISYIEVYDSVALKGERPDTGLVVRHTLTETEIAERKATLVNLPRDKVLGTFLKLSNEHPDVAKRGLALNTRYVKPYAPQIASVKVINGASPEVSYKEGFSVTRITLYKLVETVDLGVTTPEWVLVNDHVLTDAEKEKREYKFAKQPYHLEMRVLLWNDNETLDRPKDFAPVIFKTFIPAPIEITKGSEIIVQMNAAQEGTILNIAEGLTASIGAYSFKAGYTIKGKNPDLNRLAEITMNAQWNIEGEIEKPIVFENIKFIYGTAATVFKIATAGGVVGKVLFKNCVFKEFPGGIFQMTDVSTTVDSLVFQNCILEWTDVTEKNKNGGILVVNTANGTVNDLVIKNSTIKSLPMTVVRSEKTGKTRYNLLMENVTMYDNDRVPDELSRPGVDAVQIFRNMVFAKDEARAATTYFRPIIGGQQPGNSNLYKTEDYLEYTKDGKTYNIKGAFNVLGATSADVFVSPNTGNFAFRNAEQGKLGIGDPRWWPKGTTPMPY